MTTNVCPDDPLESLRRELLDGPWQRKAASGPAEQWRLAVTPFVRAVLEWAENPTAKLQRDFRPDRTFVFAMSLKRMGQIDKVLPGKKDSHFSDKLRASHPYHRDRVDLTRWLARAIAYAPYAPSPEGMVWDRIAPALLAIPLMSNWAACAIRAFEADPGKDGRDTSVPEEWMTQTLTVARALSPVSTPWVIQQVYRSWDEQRTDAAAFWNSWAHETQRIKRYVQDQQIDLPSSLPAPARSAKMGRAWCALNLVSLLWSQMLAPKVVQNLLAMDQTINFQGVNMDIVRQLYAARDLQALEGVDGRDTGAGGAPTDRDGAGDTPSVGRSRPRRI